MEIACLVMLDTLFRELPALLPRPQFRTHGVRNTLPPDQQLVLGAITPITSAAMAYVPPPVLHAMATIC